MKKKKLKSTTVSDYRNEILFYGDIDREMP